MKFIIREIKKDEVDTCILLFQETVHSVGARDYTKEQLDAWAPLMESKYLDNYSNWKELLDNFTYIAEYNGQIVGFGDLTHGGYLDRLYVHKDYQGAGIGAAILEKIESVACQRGIKEIITESSIIAKPFFIKMGYLACEEKRKQYRGAEFVNWVMRKKLVDNSSHEQ